MGMQVNHHDPMAAGKRAARWILRYELVSIAASLGCGPAFTALQEEPGERDAAGWIDGTEEKTTGGSDVGVDLPTGNSATVDATPSDAAPSEAPVDASPSEVPVADACGRQQEVCNG